jgi:hypothetical protein
MAGGGLCDRRCRSPAWRNPPCSGPSTGEAWRWRESNPRPSASGRDFSERSRCKGLGSSSGIGTGRGAQLTLSCPGQPVGAADPVSPDEWRPCPARGAWTRRTSLLVGSECELRMLGVCWCFRLFYVAPETTARFSRLDHRSRNRLRMPKRGHAIYRVQLSFL